MSGPASRQAALDAERPVVMAEAREQPGPQVRLRRRDARRCLRRPAARRPLADRHARDAGGATAATREGVPRPLVPPRARRRRHLGRHGSRRCSSGWSSRISPAGQGIGAAPRRPRFRQARPTGQPTPRASVEPALPAVVTLAGLRPWTVVDDTVIFNQKRMIDLIAVAHHQPPAGIARARRRQLHRRAGADLDDVARSANVHVRDDPAGRRRLGSGAEGRARGDRRCAARRRRRQAEIDRESPRSTSSMKQRRRHRARSRPARRRPTTWSRRSISTRPSTAPDEPTTIFHRGADEGCSPPRPCRHRPSGVRGRRAARVSSTPSRPTTSPLPSSPPR